MKIAVMVVAGVIVLAILGAAAYALFWAGGHAWARLAELERDAQAVLLTAVASVLLASLIVAGAIRVAGRAVGRTQLLSDKLVLYQEMVRHYRDQVVHDGTPEPAPLPDDFEAELLLLGALAVLGARANLVQALRDPETSPGERMRSLATLIKAMRRDLGHPESFEELKLDRFASEPGGPGTGYDAASPRMSRQADDGPPR